MLLQSLTYGIPPPGRRKPATINLDDSEEDPMDVDEPSQTHQHRQPAILGGNNGSESTSEGDENTYNTENNPSDGNNDLTDLNTLSLQKKFTSEVKLFHFLFICIYYLLSLILHSAPTVEKPSCWGRYHPSRAWGWSVWSWSCYFTRDNSLWIWWRVRRGWRWRWHHRGCWGCWRQGRVWWWAWGFRGWTKAPEKSKGLWQVLFHRLHLKKYIIVVQLIETQHGTSVWGKTSLCLLYIAYYILSRFRSGNMNTVPLQRQVNITINIAPTLSPSNTRAALCHPRAQVLKSHLMKTTATRIKT